MLQRARNENNKDYPNYGGCGRGVCEDYCVFTNWFADLGERPSGCTQHRVNNEKGYLVGNCAWADASTQNANRRRKKALKHKPPSPAEEPPPF